MKEEKIIWMNMSGAGNRTVIYIMCYCLIANVHDDGKDSILVASARLHTLSQAMCMYMYTKLGWGTLPSLTRHFCCCTFTIFATCTMHHHHHRFFFRTISFSWSNWSHFKAFIEFVVLTARPLMCHRKRKQNKQLYAHICCYFIVVFYTCNNSSICTKLSPFL